MHESCRCMHDGEHFDIIVLVASFVLCDETVIPVKILYEIAMTTHTNLHSCSIT